MKRIITGSLAIALIFLCLLTSCTQEITNHIVSFKDEGILIKEIAVESGKLINKSDLPTPSKEGKSFDGWYSENKEFDFDTPITSDITLTANWSPLILSVSFTSEETILPPTSQEIIYGNTINKPEDPSLEGFIFLGWFLGDSEYDFNTEVKEDITLTAKWSVTVCPAFVQASFALSITLLKLRH